jgi:putative oxidoreductase
LRSPTIWRAGYTAGLGALALLILPPAAVALHVQHDSLLTAISEIAGTSDLLDNPMVWLLGANYHRIACGENNAMKPYALIRSVLLGNRSWEQFAILLARVSLGLFFAISGGNKLFVASRTHQMYETLAGAGIPFPHFMTYFISTLDFIGGCLLVIGLLSSLWCAALIIEMVVAITTVQLATIPTGLSFLNWLDELLYLPETMYIIILIWLICSGPGRVSVDSRIARAFGLCVVKTP